MTAVECVAESEKYSNLSLKDLNEVIEYLKKLIKETP